MTGTSIVELVVVLLFLIAAIIGLAIAIAEFLD